MLTPHEEELIKIVSARTWPQPQKVKQRLEVLTQELITAPFGSYSTQFVTHFAKNETTQYCSIAFKVRMKIEHYVHALHRGEDSQSFLNDFKDMLRYEHFRWNLLIKKRWISSSFLDKKLIEMIYAAGDQALITALESLTPALSMNFFKSQALPELIQQRKESSTSTVLGFLDRHKNNEVAVEKTIVGTQRRWRAKVRLRDEVARLGSFNTVYSYRHINPEAMIKNANRYYRPRCTPQLARRLIHAAEQVTLFDTVTHYTANTYLGSIFDDGLFGRRTLQRLYMPFIPSALHQNDIEDGDENVICLGPFLVDKKVQQVVSITFNVKELIDNNRSVFYKQRDFNYLNKTKHTMVINGVSFSFIQNIQMYFGEKHHNNMHFFDDDIELRTSIFNFSFMSYNSHSMHAILTLNFFRYLDTLLDIQVGKGPAAERHKKNHLEFVEKIYKALESLTDTELVTCLTELGKMMTETAEFNFTGAHKINIDTIKEIRIRTEALDYTLNMSFLLNELQNGQDDTFVQAKAALPELFTSYRFLDYLLSKVSHPEIITQLRKERDKCTTPFWYSANNAPLPSAMDSESLGCSF